MAPRPFAPITKASDGVVASGGGNATFTIKESPSRDHLWRGTAWIESLIPVGPAPSGASSQVTAGGESWGFTNGGAGLFAEAKFGEQIIVMTTGLTAGVTYVARFKGNDLLEDFAASEVGYLSPFPSSQH